MTAITQNKTVLHIELCHNISRTKNKNVIYNLRAFLSGHVLNWFPVSKNCHTTLIMYWEMFFFFSKLYFNCFSLPRVSHLWFDTLWYIHISNVECSRILILFYCWSLFIIATVLLFNYSHIYPIIVLDGIAVVMKGRRSIHTSFCSRKTNREK